MKLAIEIRARQGKLQELYQTLEALLAMIREEKGGLECHIFRDVENDNVLSLTFHWKSLSDLEHYMKSESGGALLGAIDLLSETARISFDRDTPREGIDSLKRMRKKPGAVSHG